MYYNNFFFKLLIIVIIFLKILKILCHLKKTNLILNVTFGSYILKYIYVYMKFWYDWYHPIIRGIQVIFILILNKQITENIILSNMKLVHNVANMSMIWLTELHWLNNYIQKYLISHLGIQYSTILTLLLIFKIILDVSKSFKSPSLIGYSIFIKYILIKLVNLKDFSHDK